MIEIITGSGEQNLEEHLDFNITNLDSTVTFEPETEKRTDRSTRVFLLL